MRVMPVSVKRLVEDIAGEKAPGPSVTFTVFHLFSALELLSGAALGRNRLAKKLNVGGGAVRTIISRLRGSGMIKISQDGCSLTRKGLEVWGRLEQVFPRRVELAKSELSGAEFSFAFLVKNCGDRVRSGIILRDAAVIAGAREALVAVFKKGHLRIASVSECVEKDYPTAAGQILEELSPGENDVVVVAGADSIVKAKQGAFAASWSLIDV